MSPSSTTATRGTTTVRDSSVAIDAAPRMRPDVGIRPEASADLPVERCLPGTYAGRYECTVSFLGFPFFPWSGDLTLVLEQGEGFDDPEFPTLTVAPGAMLAGMDTIGGTFSGRLEGELDCRTGELSGALVGASYVGGGGTFSVAFDGDLSAFYEPGLLVAGAMGPLRSDQVALTETDVCTWQAELQR